VLAAIWPNRRRVREWRARAALRARDRLRAWARHVLQAGLLHAAFFVFAGLILWGLAAAIRAPGAPALAPSTAVSALAMPWWAGFVVPGSSAGVGVREAVLVLTLEPHLPGDGALLLALALRPVTTFGDLLFFVICRLARSDPPVACSTTRQVT
jgi:hypothetical protein